MIAAVEDDSLTRAGKLAALRALRLGTLSAGNASVSGAAAKSMLRSIDDHGDACWASVETLAAETCLDARTARRAIQALSAAGIITVTEKPGTTKTICINWAVVETFTTPDTMSPRTSCPSGHHDRTPRTSCPPTPDTMSGDPGHHDPRSVKEASIEAQEEANKSPTPVTGRISSSKQKPEPKYEPSDMDAAKHLWDRITEIAGVQHRPPNFEKWANTFRLMRERDNRSPAEILAMIDVAHDDRFWRTNILSPETLREKWLKLTILRNERAAPADPSHRIHRRREVQRA